jgi:prepilin-type N-terminal cleavage/methylation domain-containing protein
MRLRNDIQRMQRGFTLIEMVITVMLVGIVFVFGSMMLGRAFESYDATQKTTDVDWQGRVALERMIREIRNIRSNTDLTLSATSTDPIFFVNGSGNTACFCYESVTKTVRRGTSVAPNCGAGGAAPTATCGANATQPLADNVVANGLNIYYYTTTGTAAATAAQVQTIVLSLAVTEGTISETYRAGVQPRNVP